MQRFIHPDDRETVEKISDKEYMKSATEDGRNFMADYRLIMHDGAHYMRLKAVRTEDLNNLIIALENIDDEMKSREEEKQAAKKIVEPVRYKKYVVRPGDSLWTIASANRLNIDSLYGTNILRNPDRLSPGTELRIPNQDGIFYIMKKGETIEAVSKRYGVSMNKIKQVNAEKDVALLKTGDEIFLPGLHNVENYMAAFAAVLDISRPAP